MRDFLDHELLDCLMQASGGVLGHVRLIGKGSVAGATASAGLRHVLWALETAILEKTNATVHTEIHITGSISYTGLGVRVHTNGAAGVVESLAHAISKNQHNRVIRSVRLSELPPVGENRDERSRYMLEVEQAVQCVEVGNTLDRLEPNASQDGPLGNIKTVRSVHFAPLHPRFHVACDIAPGYAKMLRQVLIDSKPQPSLVHKLRLNTQQHELPREDLQSILARADATEASELVNLLAHQGMRTIGTVEAILATGETVQLSDAPAVWATLPSTTAQVRERLILQNTSLHLLDQEIATQDARLAGTEEQVGRLGRQIARTVTASRHPTFGTRLRDLFSAPTALPDQLGADAGLLRRAVDQQQQLKGELDALQTARKLVESERDFTVRRLSTMAACLESAVPRGQQHRVQPTVVAKPLDSVFADLCALPIHPDDDAVSRFLLRSVAYVTEPGLAAITAAEPPRLDTVALKIVRHEATSTPPWGGRPRPLDGCVIHVLPPLAPETADKLQDLIRAQGCRAPVVVAERMPASLNCTTLFFTPVTDLKDDIFTQFIQSNLKAAYDDKHRSIIFAGGTAALEELGITIEDRVIFHDSDQQGNHS
ncbi:MAG: hypothetical protein GX616_26405 [Planctomycetes bacterium]|nr:hypothetical protein [Planctomycetota bacterium]